MKHNSGDYAGALADHEKVVANYPGFAAGFNERGKARQQLNDVDGARADFSVAIAHFPDYADAYHRRGVARSRLGDPPAACGDWRRRARSEARTPPRRTRSPAHRSDPRFRPARYARYTEKPRPA
jgi:tetratricopeptide (TPR) repeat protein